MDLMFKLKVLSEEKSCEVRVKTVKVFTVVQEAIYYFRDKDVMEFTFYLGRWLVRKRRSKFGIVQIR